MKAWWKRIPLGTRAFLVVLVVLVGIGVGAACTSVGKGGGGGGTPPASDLHSVVYTVSGSTSTVILTYILASGKMVREAYVHPPRTMSFRAPLRVVYIAAQNTSGSGDEECTITVDGKQVADTVNSGPYTVCTASATL